MEISASDLAQKFYNSTAGQIGTYTPDAVDTMYQANQRDLKPQFESALRDIFIRKGKTPVSVEQVARDEMVGFTEKYALTLYSTSAKGAKNDSEFKLKIRDEMVKTYYTDENGKEKKVTMVADAFKIMPDEGFNTLVNKPIESALKIGLITGLVATKRIGLLPKILLGIGGYLGIGYAAPYAAGVTGLNYKA